MTPRERIIRLVLRILAHPYQFTKRELADYFGETKERIKGDVKILKAIGLNFRQDKSHHRCAIIPDNAFNELQYLLTLTDEDRAKISRILSTSALSSKEVLYLNNKLSSLYDFQKLGIQALRRPALERLDRLELAKKKKVQVILENYRSNSNNIRNRIVEPFHIDAELDTLQAYDVENTASKHFRLNRIERITLTDKSWQFESKHIYKYTDVFRIANNEQVMVHLRFDVYAFNALVEAYPKARADIYPAAEQHFFDFQSKINAEFLGVKNFILGNPSHVEVISPTELKEVVRNEAKKMIEKYK